LAEDYTLSNGKTTRSREAAYADALRTARRFNKNVLDLAVDAGLLKRDDVDALWSNPFYVPFYREAEAEGSDALRWPRHLGLREAERLQAPEGRRREAAQRPVGQRLRQLGPHDRRRAAQPGVGADPRHRPSAALGAAVKVSDPPVRAA
jgi:hypothetical protein